jgi:hypothetical protein
LLLLLRRHLARVHRIEHLLPLLRRLDACDGKRQIVEAELSLLLLRAVAGDAVLLEQGAVLFRHGDTRRLLGGGDSHPKRSQS